MSTHNPAREAHDAISTCPVCEGDLRVTRLQCDSCGTAIEGRFALGRFASLGRDQMTLLESFLRVRGNLRELERELGISYPTVRNRIDALLRALDLGDGSDASRGTEKSEPAADPALRRQVLERLAKHEISAEEAAIELAAITPEETGT